MAANLNSNFDVMYISLPRQFQKIACGVVLACISSAWVVADSLLPEPQAELRTDGGGQRHVRGFAEKPPLSIPGGESFQHRGSEELKVSLLEPLKERGTVAGWFYISSSLERSKGSEEKNLPVFAVPGVLSIHVEARPHSQAVMLVWEGRDATEVIVPRLPGPDWYHLCVAWDAPRGSIGVWLNGTNYFRPGATVSPWSNDGARALLLPVGGIPLSRVQFWPQPLTAEQVEKLVPEEAQGTMDRLMGTAPLGKLEEESRRGERLHKENLLDRRMAGRWRAEGPLKAKHRKGWVELASGKPDGPGGHIVWWSPLKLPDSFYAEWEFQILSEAGLCIVFFGAHNAGGKDIFPPDATERDGTFHQYIFGDFSTYHISYWANTPGVPRAMANLRKSPGFYLLDNGPMRVHGRSDRIYRATLLKEGARIRMAIDGELIIDAYDDGSLGPAWGEGRFGLRQMSWTHARYRNLEFYSLIPASP